jgi:hypothetical protein
MHNTLTPISGDSEMVQLCRLLQEKSFEDGNNSEMAKDQKVIDSTGDEHGEIRLIVRFGIEIMKEATSCEHSIHFSPRRLENRAWL